MIAAAWEHAGLAFILAALLGAGIAAFRTHSHDLDADDFARHFQTIIRED